MKIKVLDINGQVVSDLQLNKTIWNIEPHQQAMFDATISQQASLRQGTHKVKNRSDVSGGGRKPWRQKGTGRARQGSIRSPQWKGGGVVFGPTTNRNYSLHVNRKVRKLALKSALSLKTQEKDLIVLDKWDFEKPSTKKMNIVLNNLKIEGLKTLVVTKENDDLVFKSGRNLQNLNIIESKQVNIYELLNAHKLLITVEAIKIIEEGLS